MYLILRGCRHAAHRQASRKPPSLRRICPVIQPASSEHRKATSAAVSLGRPRRPIGVSARTDHRVSGVIHPVSFGPGSSAPPRHGRPASPGSHQVRPTSQPTSASRRAAPAPMPCVRLVPVTRTARPFLPMGGQSVRYGGRDGGAQRGTSTGVAVVSGPLPLDGLRVLDLTHALAGPYGTMLLGDLGADVIKIEAPGEGDHARRWGPPFVNGESAYFLSVNRNKRSVALDLKKEAGLQAAFDLALVSDVLVENFRPGTAARLGLGWDVLHERRPELGYASISGFGQGRPSLAGYDQIAQGTSGLMSITGEPQGQPTKVGVPVGDLVAGMFAAHAIM